ncbi:SulP family inorganic anion transporter [Kineosporia rhizophila]|uniref:SulP family inorganic anion transporter n=1 Tax=Kineosporia TaxID=49184 RepID=UPI001E5F729C|nr:MULTISPECIES: SulP family inorganic anion transporter [Kineosporia]MCE0539127.1 SulP family inorganic anion transporter [Kineosporia rhizophila]GLY18111.1 sodium-independent anion transporter [Kineosporia sp. NBRC 101677]
MSAVLTDPPGPVSGPEGVRRPEWLRSWTVLRVEVLAGLVTAFALIPEVISFSIVAGLDPRVGLFTSFVMAVVIAFTGGRPAMVTAAAGSTALVIAPLAKEHGLDFVIAAVLLGGLIQVALALLGVARLMRFIPRSVMIGFVNALAILIFSAQLPHLFDVPALVYPLLVLSIVIIVFAPRFIKAVPAPLISIVVVTALAIGFGMHVPTVGEEGKLPDGLPLPGIPDIPWTMDTLTLILPFSLGLALVGLLETLLTAKLVDDITDTGSDKTREAAGLGVANLAAGAFGGMGGCAMIGQTMINVNSGGRHRLSTFMAGAWLLVLVLLLGPVVADMPMVALVAVMVVVSATTFDWHSVAPATLRRMPRSETLVMLVTVAVTVATNNLAYGVIIGVLAASVLFARRVAHLVTVTAQTSEDGSLKTYQVHGQLFFASSNDIVHQFDYAGDPQRVVIDLTTAQIWDASSVAAMDAISTKYAARGKEVTIVGMNPTSEAMHLRLAGKLG